VLYNDGHHVKPGRLDQPKITDGAPTVLALSGLPPARDMPGRVLTEALDLTVPPAVATYETGTAAATRTARDTSVSPEIVERLKSLGYIGGTSPAPASAAPATTSAPGLHSPQGEKNLAAMHFEAGRYAES